MSLLTAFALVGASSLGAPPAAQAQTTLEARFAERINQARVARGLAPLRLRAGLSDYARQHSASMSSQRTLFHTANFSVICCWSSIAENVGTGFSVRQVHRAFMASPAHRANILDRSMRAMGIGVVSQGGRIWVTQIFRRPS